MAGPSGIEGKDGSMANRANGGKTGGNYRSGSGGKGRAGLGGKGSAGAGGEGSSRSGTAERANAHGRRGGARSGKQRSNADVRRGGSSRPGSRGDKQRRMPVDPAAAFADLEALLRERYGDETAALIVEGYRADRPVTLRANALKTTPDAVRAALDAAGIAWRDVPWSPEALVVEGAREDAVRALPAYERGEIYLQSLSSMVPPLVLSPRAGESVLDMAAAPGGKTTQMAALSGGKAQITACERSTPRAERLRFNLERQGAGRVSVLVQDARRLDPFFRFEKILLDAPCSGSGTVSRAGGADGDGAWKTGFSPKLLANCVRTQEGLLRKALQLLSPGGELAYSTCSVLPEENDGLVRSVLEDAGEGTLRLAAGAHRARKGGRPSEGEGVDPGARFEVAPIDPGAFEGMPLLPCALEGALCIRPSELYEGFFVCHLHRVK